jgi:5-methylcytosine-specific restriction endonuclease McrA
MTFAQMVDHIAQIRLGGSRLDFTNLQSLCNRCHDRKRQTERGT